jgi:hypothetical protein
MRELAAAHAKSFDEAPLAIPTTMNFAFDTVLRVRRAYGHDRAIDELDRPAYFRTLGQELLSLHRQGVDVKADASTWVRALRRETVATQLAVAQSLARQEGRRGLVGLARRAGFGPALSAIRKRARPDASEAMIFRGDEHGFTNIAESVVAAVERLDIVRGPSRSRAQTRADSAARQHA